jgi:DNA-binding XRE family transcriptional regulator
MAKLSTDLPEHAEGTPEHSLDTVPATSDAAAPSRQDLDPPTPTEQPTAARSEMTSLERMALLRRLVREQGLEAEAAAREAGVDPIIAQLWLRLPDDLWPAAPATASPAPESRAHSARAPAPAPLAAPPPAMLRRVLACRIPAPAYDRLRAGGSPLVEAAAAALEQGLAAIAAERPPVAPGGWRFPRRPLAVPIPAGAYAAVLQLAQEAFNNDPRDAAGWLIARGLGMALPLPTPAELAGAPYERSASPAPSAPPAAPATRFIVPPRRRPEPRVTLPPDDAAPSGDELRRRREAIGLSQRDLAAASGLSRGLVAEIERGRRRHVLTRLRLAETLASLEKSQTAGAAGAS